ncbi:cellulose-growth-specific [Pyrenophora seminiperda CCB06]|uniref:lytic cellulose monooxygenase (C4-dehydrogenating) n=1 Tax=Pyrenophora seminiperda CCB06 TaxID=1302712 RepID=A0A3M7M4W0_9PLEO|nr:cellulose-growth-specific [Pyrenophora seminiperda CCB06]
MSYRIYQKAFYPTNQASIIMKYIVSALAFATAVAAHGYVDNATISGTEYTFYQPYTDPYTNGVKRISRPIQGNGPVQDVTISDIQCGGYAAGGVFGSKPAALHAEAAAGSDVKLYWTLWPDTLHAAYQYPGAQFYPGCHQLKVTGGGSTKPTGLVSFPGAYKGSDAGITYDAYKAQPYTIPGPKKFTC